jgi:hypothetical protein
MYPAVVEVTPLSDFQLRLAFSNGEVKKFDMRPYLNIGIFKDLNQKDMFNTVRVNFDTISWANEADIDPETLYEAGEIEV